MTQDEKPSKECVDLVGRVKKHLAKHWSCLDGPDKFDDMVRVLHGAPCVTVLHAAAI